MKYTQKYERTGNSTTYCSDTVMPYITKTQSTNEQRGCILPFPKKSDLGIDKNYIHSAQDLQCSTTQPHRAKNWEDT